MICLKNKPKSNLERPINQVVMFLDLTDVGGNDGTRREPVHVSGEHANSLNLGFKPKTFMLQGNSTTSVQQKLV